MNSKRARLDERDAGQDVTSINQVLVGFCSTTSIDWVSQKIRYRNMIWRVETEKYSKDKCRCSKCNTKMKMMATDGLPQVDQG